MLSDIGGHHGSARPLYLYLDSGLEPNNAGLVSRSFGQRVIPWRRHYPGGQDALCSVMLLLLRPLGCSLAFSLPLPPLVLAAPSQSSKKI
jgi:hypothetical protein